MRFPPSLLDEIRARLPVSQVVSRKVALKRQGREYIGLSPFKAERSPSFTVNDQKGFYHCFASGEHGDIFKFVMTTEGLGFPEAVERLAAEAGVPMPRMSAEAERRHEEQGRLYGLMEAAARFFCARLAGREGADTRDYLARRGLSPETIARFRIGHAPESRSALKDHLAGLGYSPAEQAEAGVVVSGEGIAVPYDRFRNRVIIPITDLKGRVIAFGARALAPDQKPKYLNSPETPLFHKGSVLFNAGNARGPAHDAGTVVVVEGYMDVIALDQAGFRHAVAPLGTALTEEQVRLLWRLAPEPILCFDGDAAGRRAANRAVDVALPMVGPGASLRFAFLPDGLDPDDLVRSEGPGAVRRVLDQATSMIDVLWQRERDLAPTDTPERRAALDKRLADLVRRIAEPAVREQYGREIRRLLKALEWSARRGERRRDGEVAAGGRSGEDWRTRERARAGRRDRLPPPPSAGAHAGDALRRSRLVLRDGEAAVPREALILRTMLAHPWLIEAFAEEVAAVRLTTAPLARLRDELLGLHAAGVPLDRSSISTHLERSGLDDALSLADKAITHRCDRFAEPGAPDREVEVGFRHLMLLQARAELEGALAELERRYIVDGTELLLDEMNDIRARLAELDARHGAEDGPGRPGALEAF
ncbi:MAG: DNA primase [Hyphomicrobiaceae bacterium]